MTPAPQNEQPTDAANTASVPVIDPSDVAAKIAADAPRVAEKAPATPQKPATVATTPTAATSQNTAPIAGAATDRAGIVFDPLRHLPKTHPVSGRWMPRKQRKTPQTATAAPQTTVANATLAMSQNTATAPANATAPETPAWTDAERAEAAKPTATAPDATAPTDTPQNAAPVASAEDVAELASNSMYALTGALLNNHKAARPSAAEHANIKKVGTAYLRSKNIVIVGGLALAVTALAYLLGDERREIVVERVKAFVGLFRRKQIKTVQAVSVQTEQTPPAQPQPVATHKPAFQPL